MTTTLRTRIGRAFARMVVDPDHMLGRYPDLAAAKVDPVTWFAEHWHHEPVRAPSPRGETALFALSPLVVLLLHLAGRDRQDWLDCLRKRILDLSCTDRKVQHGLALRIARLVGDRLQKSPERLAALRGGGLGRTMPVVPIGAGETGARVEMVEPAGTYTFREPQDIDERREPVLRTVERPALWCATVPEASVFGSFQVAAGGALIRYEPAADPTFRFVARQSEFVIGCYPKRRRAVLARMPATPDATIDEAVLLGGRCGANYFHFLIEYLTRGRIIEALPQLAGLPLIVTEEMFPQEYEALDLVLPGRTLIRRRYASRLDVRRLHIPSLMTDLPDSGEVPFWRLGGLNSESLAWLRTRVLSSPTIRDRKIAGPERIYLARSGARSILNAPEIVVEFRRAGFTVIDPSQHDFAKQVHLFAGATHIAGPMGAAFSNLLFAQASTRVLVLSSPFLVRFPIFANLAAFAGCHYTALSGERPDFRPGMADERAALERSHGDFSVDPVKLRRILANL
ncbi:glycosyltransferase family 61 protein [Methylobacterium sp. J-070]|uniref:glycosyltransferase family 61 protein n=1 Tax=Methylobacterium sp. J-070 TaxID=2836650 RepID=UPI001FB9145F|nr:glycosyltransferase 61 family protein [Methylobacterium sp. J-070]MCJ2054941.1 glycosyltransferase family 61 protein [Methylobacterium sp. J-070]